MGKSLLGALSNSPEIRNDNTALVLIGHSLGGLVIKKAYVLAHQENKSLASRVRSLYFLGTPHRGSDSAKLLKNILQVASSTPPFVVELMRGSGVLQSINDSFRQYSSDVEIWSFYETQKLKVGALSTLIVDPESATLGYREEKQVPMNADHRSICKFDAPSDPNYLTIRNALASTLDNIATTGTEPEVREQRTVEADICRPQGCRGRSPEYHRDPRRVPRRNRRIRRRLDRSSRCPSPRHMRVDPGEVILRRLEESTASDSSCTVDERETCHGQVRNCRLCRRRPRSIGRGMQLLFLQAR